MYEQVGRGKLVHDTIRHGRFTIIVEQSNDSLYKEKHKDVLLSVLNFSYSVQDTMTVLHYWHLFWGKYLEEKPVKSMI